METEKSKNKERKKDIILKGDFLDLSKNLPDKSFSLAILDPPYNVGADDWDNVPDYLNWLIKVVKETRRLLKDDGSIYLWGMSKNNDFLKIKLWMDDNLDFEFKNWIVWVHDVKIHKKLSDRYLTKHEDLLFYSGKNSTFNQVRDDPPEFQLKMHKGKFDENFFVKKENLFPSQQEIFKNGLQLGSPAKSWWKGPANKSTSKIYKNFMGYKSEWVSERIINVSSNVGDNILIPFAGTGTECVSAKNLNRNYWSCEIDKERCKLAKDRVK